MQALNIRPFLQDIGAAANQLDHEVYIVGGYVRNKLYAEFNNKPVKDQLDIDLVINTDAIEFTHKFQKYYEDHHPEHLTFEIIEEFDQFGTIKIKHPEYPKFTIELASTRTETYPEPAAFPKVEIIDDIEADLARRDFTINALLLSLNKKDFGEVIDHVGGIEDLRNGQVKVFHDESFIDDPTRIYRAIRFKLEYDFKIEAHTYELLLAALKHPDMEAWQKKRKSRFAIELTNIAKLGDDKLSEAKALISL